jgi:hypothetical protein
MLSGPVTASHWIIKALASNMLNMIATPPGGGGLPAGAPPTAGSLRNPRRSGSRTLEEIASPEFAARDAAAGLAAATDEPHNGENADVETQE